MTPTLTALAELLAAGMGQGTGAAGAPRLPDEGPAARPKPGASPGAPTLAEAEIMDLSEDQALAQLVSKLAAMSLGETHD